MVVNLRQDEAIELWREALGPVSELRMQAVWYPAEGGGAGRPY